MNKSKLSEYSKKVFSQAGEDGVIEEILKRISSNYELDKWCVEFGAWDGVHLSNTCNLIRNKNYKAVLIEGDKNKLNELKKNFPTDDVIKIGKFITFDGKNTLDEVLSKTSIPNDFDFLSIDVDGVDYYIFESLNKFKPKVICIEFNGTIPNFVNFIQPKDFKVKQGASAKSIIELGEKKGYKLAIVIGGNLILIKDKYFKSVLDNIPTLEDLNPLGNETTCIFIGYDGTILSNKDSIFSPWHGITIKTYGFQFLPRFLRKFSGDYGFIKKLFLKIYKYIYYAKMILFYPKKSFKTAQMKNLLNSLQGFIFTKE